MRILRQLLVKRAWKTTNMRTVLTLASLLAVAVHYAAGICNTPTYNETLVPQCVGRDLDINWPNYENQSTYYRCVAANQPVLVACSGDTIFSFVYQRCRSCDEYLPPVPCAELKTQNPPKCVPITQGQGGPSGSGSTGSTAAASYPTPYYPDDSSSSSQGTAATAAPTAAPTASSGSATDTTSSASPPSGTSSTDEVPTPPSGSSTESSSTDSTIPTPPSPSTISLDIPMPPTPAPTPPSVNYEPPSIPAPQSSG